CYTNRCLAWADCGNPLMCRADDDCLGAGEACVEGLCTPVMCERQLTVLPGDPNYFRFEGSEIPNACASDDDCVASGCSGEVCAALAVDTTCDVLPNLPQGACGCVNGECLWYRDSCGGGCEADADADGICDVADDTCNLDDTVVLCDAIPPVCEGRGEVPEARNGCWTGGCTIWAGCRSRPLSCGGFAGVPCPDGDLCIDDPGDECDPDGGGADCPGICVDAPMICSPVEPGEFGACLAIIGWAPTGDGQTCEQVSGCGCDARCERRVFQTEEDCVRNCSG
ncbi:MAG: hypothetical protein KC583_07595, partial [Myxococcales bacterium]|nr:hypothetical protein [Myxococcales bacterium]